MRIILASQSKRRQELLKNHLNLDFEVVVSEKDEVEDKNLTPLENCTNISYEKAKDILEKTSGDRIIISCDTVVLKNNKIYGKPKNKEDAYNMLKLLSGDSHEVLSCLTVIKVKDNKKKDYKTYGSGIVYIDEMTDDEINSWIENNNPYDKAGGYAIQEGFAKYIEKIEGDFYSVVGIPLNKLYNILKKINWQF